MSITNFDYRMFEKAKELAKTSNFQTQKLGCVIVYKKHIIGCAANSTKTHPMQKKYNRYRSFNKTNKPVVHSGHAEILALMDIPYPIGKEVNWHEVKVYVYRISKGRKSGMGLAKPCPACRAALKDAGIRHLYYTTNDSYVYERLL